MLLKKAEQLVLTDKLDDEKKIKRKRGMIIMALILTGGVSVGFWTYRKVKGIISGEQRMELIKMENKRVTKVAGNPEMEIDKILGSDNGKWWFYVQSGNFIWSKNFKVINYEQVATELEEVVMEESILAEELPKGIKIQEKVTTGAEGWEVKTLVTIPERKILMVIGIAGVDDLEKAKKLLPSLAKILYWTAVQN